jgi:3-oxoacyl-[acyl-carrier protein] reductase
MVEINMELNNKVCIVTGGATGIGKAISLALAHAGAKVVINYNSSSDAANALVHDITSKGLHAIAIGANISQFDEAKKLIDQTIEAYGQLDVLINNAGITDDTLLLRMSETQFDRVIQTNLKGVFNTVKHALRPIMKSEAGRIINIASVSGLIGNVGQTNYSAAKAGVIGFTKALAREIAGKNVTVNAVAPGFIKTKMTDKISEDIQNEFLKNIPLKRFGEPEEIANIVCFLASDLASYITGQTITVDGGMVM